MLDEELDGLCELELDELDGFGGGDEWLLLELKDEEEELDG